VKTLRCSGVSDDESMGKRDHTDVGRRRNGASRPDVSVSPVSFWALATR